MLFPSWRQWHSCTPWPVLLIERRLELRPLLYTLAGTVLGLFINPYFPNNLVFAYRHMLPKLTETTEISVGNEWFPYTTRQLLENSFLSLVAFVSGALAMGLRGRRMDTRTATSFFLAILFGFMLFQSRRFIEYFPAFALIFAALSWAPLMEETETYPLGQRQGLARLAAGAGFGRFGAGRRAANAAGGPRASAGFKGL